MASLILIKTHKERDVNDFPVWFGAFLLLPWLLSLKATMRCTLTCRERSFSELSVKFCGLRSWCWSIQQAGERDVSHLP
jgi:hypothetical protein